MFEVDVTTQIKNIYLDVFIGDEKLPARALIDTGSEITLLIKDFADTFFFTLGEDAGSERIHHGGTIYFGEQGELPVTNIEFRVRNLDKKLFTAMNTSSRNRIPFDVIVGMDVLQHFDFKYFHRISRSQTRTFFAMSLAGQMP
jgi:hypothetical protein